MTLPTATPIPRPRFRLPVPILHGPVLITGVDPDGRPIGLSKAQLEFLGSGPEPNWWARIILQARAHRSERRRRTLRG